MDQTPQSTSPLPSTSPRSCRLITYQRTQVKTLYDAGCSYNRNAKHLGINRDQIRYVEVKTPPGIPTVLSPKDIYDVEVFITLTPEGHRMSWLELLRGSYRHLGVSERALKKEPQKRGILDIQHSRSHLYLRLTNRSAWFGQRHTKTVTWGD